MAQITGGTVKFGRKTAPAQYENKEAVVELTFSLAEGEELGTFLDAVGAQAQAKALELVGLQSAVKITEIGQRTIKGYEEAEKAKVEYAAKLAIEKDLEDKEKQAAKARAERCNTVKAVDDLGGIPETLDRRPKKEKADPDAGLLDLEASKEISDQELLAAVTRKNHEIKDPKKIFAVRDQFVKIPKGLRDIEQKDRPAFIAALEALKK